MAYLLFPVGRALEVLVARPAHFLISSTPATEWVFGHTPHPPLFNPRPITDVGVSRRTDGAGSDRTTYYYDSQRMASVSRGRGGAAGSSTGPGGSEYPGGSQYMEGASEGEAGGQRVIIKEIPVVRTVVKEVPKVVVKEVPKVVEVEKVTLPDVAFLFDSDRLTPLGKGKVYLAAEALKNKSGVAVVIEGHADRIGTDEYNMALGLRRAETVKKELQSLGVDLDKVSVVSVGESQPLIDKDTDWARAVNRRVEVRIDGK